MSPHRIVDQVYSILSERYDREKEGEKEEVARIQVPSKGKKTHAQTRRHTIRNSNSLVRKLSQPINITLGGVRRSVVVAEN